MSALRSLMLSFGIDVEGKKKLDEVDSAVEGILEKVTKLGVGLASVFIFKGITNFIMDTIEVGRSLGLTAEKLGVTVDELERFRYAASMAGVETSFADRALMMFNRQMGEAEIGSKAAGKGLGQLGSGFSAAQLSAMPLQDLIGLVADKFAGMTDKAAKTQLAMKLFGRQGTALIPMFNQGAAGIKKWSEEFDALGGGIGVDFAEKAKLAGNETRKLEFSWKVLSTRLVGDILPAFNKLVTFFIKVVQELEYLQKHSYMAQTALIALCAAAVAALAPFLVSIAPIVAAAEALYLVFDDIFTMFMGGNSVIGDFIDLLFGEGAHKTFVADVKKVFKDFIDWVKDDAIPAVKDFWKWLSDGSGPALTALRLVSDTFHAIYESIKGIVKTLGDLFMGNPEEASKSAGEAGSKMWDYITGGKGDDKLNADAKADFAKRTAPWKGMVDDAAYTKPPTVYASHGPYRDVEGGGQEGQRFNAATGKIDVTVHVDARDTGADAGAIRQGVAQGVKDGLTHDDVKRVMQTLPWAPGMPIPKAKP